MVKNLPAIQETRVQSLDWEDPGIEEEMATRSNILAWRIPGTEEPGGLWSMESQELKTSWPPNHHQHTGLSNVPTASVQKAGDSP